MKLLGRDVIYTDYEFNQVTEKQVNPVCCTTLHSDGTLKEWWLHKNPEVQKELAEYLKSANVITVGYALIAEYRAMMALGLNPTKFPGIDLFLEYRMLTNHNDELLYGDQLVNGVVKKTTKPPPKWERTEEDSLGSFKPTHSLAEATFKLTGEIRDTEHKNKMRDIIISGDEKLIEENKKDIQAYCTEDVTHLPEMLDKIIEHLHDLGFPLTEELLAEMLLRGKYSALTAKMESRGYPIDYDKTKNFSSAVGPIIEECQREINFLFPEVSPFKYNRKERRFSLDQKITKKWIKENADVGRWKKTDGYKTAVRNAVKKAAEELAKTTKRKLTALEKDNAKNSVDPSDYLSLSLDAWTNQFDYKHDYPKNSFAAQMVRYLKLKQNLNGFVPNANGSFWDAVGSDKRVRPYFNIYGSLSGRSQPGSKSFLFLKPAWMRSLCVPPPGRAVATIDYGSQEYLISALISECDAMIEAYDSGDVYIAFGKASGLIPPDGSKETHKAERQLAKACLAEGTLVRVKDFGLLPIESIRPGMEVWDGDSWKRVTKGSIKTRTASRDSLVKVNGVICTSDHLFKGKDGKWYPATDPNVESKEVYPFKFVQEQYYKETIGDKSLIDLYDIQEVEGGNAYELSNGDVSHNCVLAMSYLMTAIGLSAKLTADLGYPVSEEEAQEYIDLFYEAYTELADWQESIQEEYETHGYLRAPCGWTLFGDNDNFRSVVNFNIQGAGASILRKAVEFCDEEGLDVIITLHDALYIEFDYTDLSALDKFRDCMFRAFIHYFPNQIKDASKIRMDIQAWGPDFPEEGEVITPKGLKVPVSKIYVDERSVKEYEQFKKYFNKREEDEL